METFQIKPVGIIVNEINELTDHIKIKERLSTILINDEYTEGLLNIEKCEYLDIIFYFHKSDNPELTGKTKSGDQTGVFASRKPFRPNSIGVTTVKLLKREGNTLLVEGLDAINNTPVIDIKSCDTSLFASECDSNPVHNAKLKTNPRIEIRNNIARNETEILLLKAGQIHGHFCPGLAMGVMAATYAMKEINTISDDGMEDLLAITETNNCFSDGIQFVTGCTFGNNALIFKDSGKTAFTLTKRNGKGIRIASKPDSREVIQDAFPDFQQYYQKVVAEQNHDPVLMARYKKSSLERAFGTLQIPFDKLFTIQHAETEIPPYAPVHDSEICAGCGESVMKSRTKLKNGRAYCFDCAGIKYPVLDGNGIHF